jgi:hypothetical protein
MKKMLLNYLYFWGKRSGTLLNLTLYGVFISILGFTISSGNLIFGFVGLAMLVHTILVNILIETFFSKKESSDHYWEGIVLEKEKIIFNNDLIPYKGKKVMVKKPKIDDFSFLSEVSFSVKDVSVYFEVVMFYDEINHHEIFLRISKGNPGEFSFNSHVNEVFSLHNAENENIQKLLFGDKEIKEEEIFDLIIVPQIFSFITNCELRGVRIYPKK